MLSSNQYTTDRLTTSAPLVSIALCTYNGSRFLAQQLDSLIAQTYTNIEIVIQDDCSSDDTVSILDRYARADSRVRIAVNAKNLGLGRNFERVVRQCSGAYIAPCDQDDIWLPNKISALTAAIGDYPLAYCDSVFVNERGEPIGRCMSELRHMLNNTDDPTPFAFENCVSGHASLFTRELLDRALPVPEYFFYDWWLAAVATSLGGIVYCDKQLVLYRQHEANITDTLGVRTVNRSTRPRGEKFLYLRATGERLRALANLPGRHQTFISELCSLWHAREKQWISPALGYLMVRQRRRLFPITRHSKEKVARFCRQFLWGLRAKRLTNSYMYSQP